MIHGVFSYKVFLVVVFFSGPFHVIDDVVAYSSRLFDLTEHCTALRSECDLEHVLRYCQRHLYGLVGGQMCVFFVDGELDTSCGWCSVYRSTTER